MSLTKVSYSMIDGACVNALDFGLSESGTAASNATAIQAAISSFSSTLGGKVYIPRGTYDVAADIIDFGTVKYVTIEGNAPGYGYDRPYPATVLSFGAGAIGINMYDATGSQYQGNRLTNLHIKGNDVLTEGIKLNDNVVIEDVSVTGCVDYGIHMAFATNSAILNRVTCYDNNAGLGFGVFIDGQDTTVYTIMNSNFRTNNKGMVVYAALGSLFQEIVSESNYEEGLYIRRPNSSTPLSLCSFNHVYLENNWRGSPGNGLVIDAVTKDSGASVPGSLIFSQCTIAATAASQHMSLEAANGVDFINVTMSGGDLAQGMYLSPLWARRIYFHDCQLATNTSGTFGVLSGIINKANPSSSGLSGYESTMGYSSVFSRVFTGSGGLVTKVAYASQAITASSSVTVAVAVPAGAKLLGTQIRVDSTLSNAFDAAYSGGATQSITTGATPTTNVNVGALFNDNSATPITSGTTNVAITKNGGGSFSAQGSVSVWTYYQVLQDADPV